MVFKKPFAFIIRHFKAFHIILLLTSIFIMYTANQVRSLARSLISSNVFTYASAINFTKAPIYILALIGLADVGLIYWLFKSRKKDSKFYSYLIFYYVFAMGAFYYLSDKLVKLSQTEVSIDDLALIRDTGTLLILVSLPVIVICAMRSVGFNIKQFNFSKDIKDLEITNKDSEEFEVLIGQNNYKYIRKFRKTLRETKYIILENLFYITLFGLIILVLGGIFIGYTLFKNNKKIIEQEITTVNGIYYVVNKTYITSRDLNGNTVKNNNKYVIVNISMKNMYESEQKFDVGLFTLQTGRLVYRPVTYLQSTFNDLGKYIESGTVIPQDSFLTGTIIFEIPESMSVTNFNLRIFKDYNNSEDDFIVNYEKFAANGINLDNEKKTTKASLGTDYDFEIYSQNKVNYKLNKAYLSDYFEEKYIVCKTVNECETKSEVIRPEDSAKNTLLVIDYNGLLNSDANYYTTIKSMDDFFNSFASVDYTVGINKYTEKGNVLYKDLNGKSFILVDRKITNASIINLNLTFRNETVTIPVK